MYNWLNIGYNWLNIITGLGLSTIVFFLNYIIYIILKLIIMKNHVI
jgi:hypothetical protein